MAISKRIRFEILRRDNHACRYCGATAPDVALVVIPKVLGGSDDPSNLVTACAPCNSGKTSSSPDAPIVADVAADALRWGAAMQRAAEVQAQHRELEAEYMAAFAEQWNTWEADGKPFLRLTAEHYSSLVSLRKAGLTVEDLEYATEEAMGAMHIPQGRLWRYFCGICWRIVAQRREIAASLIEADEADR
jgi:hypothetical protein